MTMIIHQAKSTSTRKSSDQHGQQPDGQEAGAAGLGDAEDPQQERAQEDHRDHDRQEQQEAAVRRRTRCPW